MSATVSQTKNAAKQHKKKSQLVEILRRLFKNKGAVIGLVIVCLLVVVACLADVLYDYEEVVIHQNYSETLQGPSLKHPFGTDNAGRDVLSRVVHGARISLTTSSLAMAMSLFAGGLLGALAGFYGGKVDNIIMRIMDVFLAIPSTLLAICIVAALGASQINLIIALALSSVPSFARVTRSAVMSVRDNEYIEAARAIGATNRVLILEHILPNAMAPIIVQATLSVATNISIAAGLSFLGLGVPPPAPEWGAMLSDGRTFIRDYSYLTLFPGLAIMISILAFNLLGDGLRDALDPRLK